MGDHGLPAVELALLAALTSERKPRRTLEVGIGSGAASLAILESKPAGGVHVAVEIDPEMDGIGRLRRSNFRRQVEVRLGPSHLELPRLVREGARFDLVLLDGRHLFDYLLVDLFQADLLLEPGGLLVVDDAHWPGLFRALRYWELNRAYARLPGPNRRLAAFEKLGEDSRSGLPNTWAAVGHLFVRF